MQESKALVAVVMGSKSDWDTMEAAVDILKEFDVPHEAKVLSAHRTPDLMSAFAKEAEGRGIEVIIAGAGGAAHLPGMVASNTLLPVFGVPVKSHALKGLDSLFSIVQMPKGIPVGALAIGKSGAANAALLAISVLGLSRPELKEKLKAYRKKQAEKSQKDKLS